MLGSCSNNNSTHSEPTNEAIDSIAFYLDKANDVHLSTKERGDLAMKAYSWTHKLEDSLKPSYFISIGTLFYKINDHKNDIRFSKRAYDLASKLNDQKDIARSSFNLGLFYLKSDYKSDSAYYYFNKAQYAYRKIKDTLKTGLSILNMGIIQRYENDLLGGQTTIIRSIPYFEVAKSDRFLASAYNSLGNIDAELGDFKNAIKNHQKALKYRRRLNDKIFEAKSLNNIGVVHKDQKKYKEAHDYFNQAFAYDSLYIKDAGFYALLLNNIAYAKLKRGDDKDLPEQFFKSLKIKDSINDRVGIVTSKTTLAEYYADKNKIDSAKMYAYAAKDLAEKLKLKDDLLESLLILSRIENKDKALEFTRQYIQIKDSLQKKERVAKNQFARIRFDTDQIEQENMQITKHKKLLVYALIALFLAFASIYYLKQRTYKRRLQAVLDKNYTEESPAPEVQDKKKELDIDELTVQQILKDLKEFESGTQYLQEGISLASLSKKFNTNSSYLSKVINTYREKNFSTYINDLRITYAIERLKRDGKFRLYSIKAIAEETGYSNSQSFSTAFYKKTGIQPSYFIAELKKLDAR